MKVLINSDYGGFGLSHAIQQKLGVDCIENLRDWEPWKRSRSFERDDPKHWEWRAHPDLITAFEEVGDEAGGDFLSSLKIVEVPDDVEWIISEYDGAETVREKHRVWW